MNETKNKTVMTGQFEGSKKYLRSVPENRNEDRIYKFIKRILKSNKKRKTNFL